MARVFVRKALGLGTYFRAKKSTCYVVREIGIMGREGKGREWKGRGGKGRGGKGWTRSVVWRLFKNCLWSGMMC